MNANLTQFLIDIVRGPHCAAHAGNPEATLAASGLAPDLQAAIRAQDIAALFRAGAHPMALMYYARSIGWDNARYYACIGGEPVVTPAASAAAPRSSAPAPN